jgi:hypothetical protein
MTNYFITDHIKTTIMSKKQLLSLCFMVFMSLFFMHTNAQQSSGSQVYKDWTFIVEKANVDVFYKVLECKGRKEVHLKVFNDLPVAREVRFTFELTNGANGKKLTKEIVLQAASAARFIPECGNDKLVDLKIALPKGFDPSALIAKATVLTQMGTNP